MGAWIQHKSNVLSGIVLRYLARLRCMFALNPPQLKFCAISSDALFGVWEPFPVYFHIPPAADVGMEIIPELRWLRWTMTSPPLCLTDDVPSFLSLFGFLFLPFTLPQVDLRLLSSPLVSSLHRSARCNPTGPFWGLLWRAAFTPVVLFWWLSLMSLLYLFLLSGILVLPTDYSQLLKIKGHFFQK